MNGNVKSLDDNKQERHVLLSKWETERNSREKFFG